MINWSLVENSVCEKGNSFLLSLGHNKRLTEVMGLFPETIFLVKFNTFRKALYYWPSKKKKKCILAIEKGYS